VKTPSGSPHDWNAAPFEAYRDPGSFVLIALAVGLVFGQTLGFAFVPYDDPAYILGNEYVARGLSLRSLVWAFTYADLGGTLSHPGVENLWHPLTWISHMIDVQIFGLQLPGGHHFTNLLLHLLAAWAAYLFATRLTDSRLAGLITALLFAVHPLRAESVAWVSERKDVLSGLLFFGSLWGILKNRRQEAYVAFVAAMMAKPSAVVLPVIAILCLGYLSGEKSWGFRFWKSRLVEWRWWFVTALLVGLAAVWFQGRGSHAPLMDNLPFPFRILHLAEGILLTGWHTLVPAGLTFHYRFPDHSAWISLGAWFFLLTAVLVVWLRRAKNPRVFFAVAWFLVCAFPASGIFYVGTSLTADRYTYLSLTGGFAMLGVWVAAEPGTIKAVLAAAVLMILAIQAHRQTASWKDGWALLTHAETVQPSNPVVLGNLGALFQQDGQHPQAIALFRRALGYAPADARAWYNLGNSLRDSGDPVGALSAYREAVAANPRSASAWRNMGLLLADPHLPVRDLPGARDAFARSVELTARKDPIPLLLQAKVEFELGDIPATKSLLAELQALAPQDPRLDREWNDLRRRLPY
jgi:tetratricopeptide (TPR) repeat protein